MRASAFEFRHRFLLIGLVYAAGFACSMIDHERSALALGRLFGWTTNAPYQWLFAGAALVIGLSALLRTWASAYLQASVVHDTRLHSDRVVADGPYRYVRNPLYLGIIGLSIGMSFLASRLGAIVLIGGNILFYLRLILREESELTGQSRASYLRFKQAVPRLFPAFTPQLPASGAKPRWAQAVAGEAFMWAFTLSMAAFAVTLDPRYLYWINGVTMLICAFTLTRSRTAQREPVA